MPTSSANQLTARYGQLWYLIMFRTSGRFLNLLEDTSLLIGRETLYQLASKTNNYSITKMCMPALPHNVRVDKSNLHNRHLELPMFRKDSDSVENMFDKKIKCCKPGYHIRRKITAIMIVFHLSDPFTHTHTYIYVYTFMYIYIYIYIYTFVYTCTYVLESTIVPPWFRHIGTDGKKLVPWTVVFTTFCNQQALEQEYCYK